MRVAFARMGRPSPRFGAGADPENDPLPPGTVAIVAGPGTGAPVGALPGETLGFDLEPLGTKVVVLDDPNEYEQTGDDVERLARAAPSPEADAIRQRGPRRYEAGSFMARFRWVRVAITEGPHAGTTARFQRRRLRSDDSASALRPRH